MLNKLSLKGKFLALETMSFVMMVSLGIFAIVQLTILLDDDKENISRLQQDMTVLADIGSMNMAGLKEAKLAKDVWIRGTDADKVKKFRGEFVEQRDAFEEHRSAAVIEIQNLAEGRSGFDGFLHTLEVLKNEHQVMSDKYLAQIDAHTGNTAASDAAVAGIDRELSKQVIELRADFMAFIGEKGAEKVTQADASFVLHRNLIVGWIVVSMLLAITFATLIIRSVLKQLGGDPKQVAQMVDVMAGGDFSQHANVCPEPGSLLCSALNMQTSLRDMIAQVKRDAIQIGDMAHGLAGSAEQIASNANHESDAVSGMAAAIEELSVSTTHISDQGGNAKTIANDSRGSADQGAQVVHKTVSGLMATASQIESASAEVSRLGEDASRISEVVKVIKEIADQTNLLALNAAIEAARAGEQGRGFAVVADEVRKLAERTGNATHEINEMSGKIGAVAANALNGMGKVVATTRQGVTDAESAQNSITLIQKNFGEVAAVIDQISGSLSEQNAAATDLAQSTERVSAMSAENAASARELLNMANEMESSASQIRRAVDVFKV